MFLLIILLHNDLASECVPRAGILSYSTIPHITGSRPVMGEVDFFVKIYIRNESRPNGMFEVWLSPSECGGFTDTS